MLTEADKTWLEERKPPTVKLCPTTADDNFCKHCKQYDIDCVPWFRNTGDCPTHRGGDYREAAEFEARVAAKLAEGICGFCDDFASFPSCPLSIYSRPKYDYCTLKHARLAVEAEME